MVAKGGKEFRGLSFKSNVAGEILQVADVGLGRIFREVSRFTSWPVPTTEEGTGTNPTDPREGIQGAPLRVCR